jgi:hypothetical protein
MACYYCNICSGFSKIPDNCQCRLCQAAEPGVHPANNRKIEDNIVRMRIFDQGKWIFMLNQTYVNKTHIDWSRVENDPELGPWAKRVIRRKVNVTELIKLVQRDLKEQKRVLLLPEHFWEFCSVGYTKADFKETINLYQKEKDV